jgi:hypothetical protein
MLGLVEYGTMVVGDGLAPTALSYPGVLIRLPMTLYTIK